MLRKLLILLVMLCAGLSMAQELPAVVAVYQDANGAVMVSHDGEALTLIESVPEGANVKASISPDAAFVVVMVDQVHLNRFDYPAEWEGQMIGNLGLMNRLYVFNLESGEVVLERETLLNDYAMDYFYVSGAVYATLLDGNVGASWSPDSSRVAWIEDTAESEFGHLVMFNVADGSLTELDATGGVPYDLQWSPDSQFVIYRAINNFGTGAGYSSTGAYIVLPDNTTHALSLPQTERTSKDINAYGWLTNTQFVFSMFSPFAGASGLFVYDAADDSLLTLVEADVELLYSGIDIQPESGQIVVTVSDLSGDDVMGTYLYRSITSEPELIYNQDADVAVFLTPNLIYLYQYDREAPFYGIYHIDTGELVPQENLSGSVSASSHGVMFNQGMMIQLDGTQIQVPGVYAEYIHWLSEDVFVSFHDGSPDIHMVNISGEIQTLTLPDSKILDVKGQ
mgnify:CR=1 FL=1